jgi:hypothetical protein
VSKHTNGLGNVKVVPNNTNGLEKSNVVPKKYQWP